MSYSEEIECNRCSVLSSCKKCRSLRDTRVIRNYKEESSTIVDCKIHSNKHTPGPLRKGSSIQGTPVLETKHMTL